MKRTIIMALAMGLLAAQALAAPRPLTPTVKVEGLDLRLDDVIITPKAGYAHLLWDLFPYHDAVAAAAKAKSQPEADFRALVVKGLAQALVPAKAPKVKLVKADVVEFTERDEYGAPRWSSVKKVQKLQVTLEAPKAKAKP